MGVYRDWGPYRDQNGNRLPFSQGSLGNGMQDQRVRQETITRQIAEQAGISSLRKGQPTHYRCYPIVSIGLIECHDRLHYSCERIIREIREKNKRNCITETIDEY